MTLREDELDRDVIDVLKRAHEDAGVPVGARERVGVRLAATGIVGLTSSISAGAATSAASVTFSALSKTLVLGMALGAGVGGGVHLAFGGGEALAPTSQRADATPPVAAAAPPVTTFRPHGQIAAPPEPSRVTASNPRDAAASTPSPAKHLVNPGPELPRDEPVIAPASTVGLAEQQALLDEGRAALRRSDGGAAFDAIQRHVTRFPRTAFEEEREAVMIRALVLLGRIAEAKSRSQRFAGRFPRSLLLPSLEAALSPSVARETSVTEAGETPQSPGK